MADNFEANAGSGGKTFASDEIAGVDYVRNKLSLGADGSANDAVGGAGAVTDGVQRVTLASDDPAVIDLAAIEVLQTAIKTALEIMDDWDESDRAKVNLIVGQAGIAAGTGVDGATVPRVSLATNVPLPAGTNAIGKLSANSGVDIGDVDVTSQPARDNATDTITASLDTAAIMNDTTALTPKFAAISGATSGNNTLVAAVVGKKIRVLSLTVIAAGAVDFRLEDGAGGTALTGVMSLTTNSGFSLAFSPVGHMETTANTLLNMELSGAVQVSGCLCYVEV